MGRGVVGRQEGALQTASSNVVRGHTVNIQNRHRLGKKS